MTFDSSTIREHGAPLETGLALNNLVDLVSLELPAARAGALQLVAVGVAHQVLLVRATLRARVLKNGHG